MHSRKRKEVRTNAEETPELLAFAQEFRDESHLRQITAQLFEQMKFSEVTITHGGPTEKGKDIVFTLKAPSENGFSALASLNTTGLRATQRLSVALEQF